MTDAPAEREDRLAPMGDESTAFDLAPTAAVVVNSESRIEAANIAAKERFSGIALERTVLEAFGQHLLAEPVSESLRDGEVRRLSVRVFSDGGGTYRATLVPFGVQGARRLALYLGDESEAADFKLLRSQFLTNASHELRTPLTGLSAMLETLDGEDLDEGTRRRFTSRAREESGRLAELVHDILLLSELEAERNVPDSTVSDLTKIAATVIAELDEPAAVEGILLNLEAASAAQIQLTPSLARTLVQNLVENAVRYAGVGSEVIIRVRAEGDDVVLEVSDDGVGIDEAHLSHVFERFYRADPHRSREVGGTGLGLSIVRHIAERLGGRAEVESRVGRGTTVRVVVPKAR